MSINPYRPPYVPHIEVRPELSMYRDSMSGHLIKEITEQAAQQPINPIRQQAYAILASNGWANEPFNNLWKMSMAHLDLMIFGQGQTPNNAQPLVAEAQCRFNASSMVANQPMLMNSLDPATKQKIQANIQEFQTVCSQIQTHERNLQAAKGNNMYQMYPGMMPGMMQPNPMMPNQMMPNPMMPMMHPGMMGQMPMMPGGMPMHPGMMAGAMQPNPMMGMGMPMGQPPQASQMPAVAYQRPPIPQPYGLPQYQSPTNSRMGVAALPGANNTQPVQVQAPQAYQQQHPQPYGVPMQQPQTQQNLPPAQVSSGAPVVMAQPQTVASIPQQQPQPPVLTQPVPEPVEPPWSERSPYHLAYDLQRFKTESIDTGFIKIRRLREIKMQNFDIHDTRRYLSLLPGGNAAIDNAAFIKSLASVTTAKKIAAIKRELAKAPKTEGVEPVVAKPVHLGDFVQIDGSNSYRDALGELIAGSGAEFDSQQPMAYRMVSYQPWYVDSSTGLRNLENATSYDDLHYILATLFSESADGGVPIPLLKKVDEAISEYVSFVLCPGIGLGGRVDSFLADWTELKQLVVGFSSVAMEALNRSFKTLMNHVININYGKDTNMQFSEDGKDDGEDRVSVKSITDVVVLPIHSSTIGYGGEATYGEVTAADPLHHVLVDLLNASASRYVVIMTSDDRVLYATKSFLMEQRVVLSKSNRF